MRKEIRDEISQISRELYSTEKMVDNYYKLFNEIATCNRILEVDVNYKYSSTGKIVHSIYMNAKKHKKTVAVAYGRGKKTCDTDVLKFGFDIETFIHAILSRITGFNGFFSFFSTVRLISFIERFKPDLIHIHELHAYFVNHTMLLKYIQKHKIPVVWTFHCEYMYTGKCGHAFECPKYQNSCGNCPQVHSYPKSLFFDQTEKMFKSKKKVLRDLHFTIVTPSNWLAERVKTSFLKDKNISIIWNGVDTSIFFPHDDIKIREKYGIGKNDKVILAVAPNVNDNNKGIQWVTKIAADAEEKVKFFIIGDGEFCGSSTENIYFLGKISDKDEMAMYYSMADVFIICSKRETYSMTCAEALCCGTPVVGFESGAPETVFKTKYARFVPYGDIEKLKEVLNKFMEM